MDNHFNQITKPRNRGAFYFVEKIMHIEIDDKYVITADKYQFIVNQKMQFGEDSKRAGQVYLKQIAFCPTLGQVATVLTMHEVRLADIDSIRSLQVKIDEFETKFADAFSHQSDEPSVA